MNSGLKDACKNSDSWNSEKRTALSKDSKYDWSGGKNLISHVKFSPVIKLTILTGTLISNVALSFFIFNPGDIYIYI